MSGVRQRVIPTTRTGRLSVWCLAAAVFLFAIAITVSMISGHEGGLVDNSHLYRLLIGIAFMVAELGALVSAAIAMFRDHERSLLTVLALIFGLLATGLLFADMLFDKG